MNRNILVSKISFVVPVAEALFDEWEDELNLYESKVLRRMLRPLVHCNLSLQI